MQDLETPTGTYKLSELHSLSCGIIKRIKSPAFSREDVYQDLIVFLLEGSTLPQACIQIAKKYRKWNKQVPLYKAPEEAFWYLPEREENVRILSDSDHTVIQQAFFSLLDRLEPFERNVMIHVSLGYTDRQMAEIFQKEYGNMRRIKSEIIKKMRGMCSS